MDTGKGLPRSRGERTPTAAVGAGPSDSASWRRDLRLFLVLGALGYGAAFLSVNIPHTEVYVEGRYAFGFMAFALLSRGWAALLMACLLAVAGFHQTPASISFVANLFYSVPALVVIRLVHGRLLTRVSNLALYGLGWLLLILFCYQAFTHPGAWMVLAYLHSKPLGPAILESWVVQPFLFESVLVGIVSALGMMVFRSQQALLQSRNELATTLDSIGDGVIATDAEGRVTRMNPIAQALTGWTLDRARGRRVEEVFRIVNARTRESAENPLKRALAEGMIVGLANDTCLIARDGTERQIADSAAIVREPDGRLIGAVMVFRDVTREYENRRALRDSRDRLDLALDAASMGIWEWTLDTGAVQWSREHAALFGLAPDTLGGSIEDMLALVHPEDRERVEKEARKAVETGEGADFTYRVARPDGSIRWLRSVGRRVDGDDDSARRVVGVTRNVTSEKKASEALERSERRFRSFVENANDIVYALTPEGVFTYISPNWLVFMGEPAENAIGKSFEAYVHPEDVGLCREFLEHVLQAGEQRSSVEYRVRHPGGGLTWHTSTGSPLRDEDGKVVGYIGIGRDVTEKKETEKALRESEARFRELLENLDNIPVQGYDEARRVIYWNKASERVYGYTQEEALGRRLEDLIVPDELREGVVAAVDQWVAGGPPVPAAELVLRDKDGEDVHVYSSHVMRVSDEGKREMFCIDVDLRTLRTAEEQTRRLATAIEQAAEIVVVTDTDANIIYVNPAFESTTGYSREEVIGKNPRVLQSGRHDKAFYGDLWKTLTGGKTWKGHFENRRKDGAIYTEEATITPVRSASGEVVNYVAVKRDITRELELEEQYRQSQKMQAIGQLTGGVAHDFNNLLQVINGGTDLAMLDLPPGHPARDSLVEVSKAGQKAGALVGQLLAFSRRQVMRPQSLELNAVVADLLKMLRRVIGEHIRLEWRPGAEMPRVRADRGMVEQMLMNLCVNARDAMPGGGALTIESGDAMMGKAACDRLGGGEPGRYVFLSVSDNGCGMDRETLQRIFEPFFTTKSEGKGTGLGLATVYGMVKQHEGLIEVQSEPKHGARFRIYLPTTTAVEKVGEEPEIEEADIPGGDETILVAEDDDMVRDLARRFLQRAGYTVLIAPNGAEALALFERNGSDIDLALLDIIMPEMGGPEAYRKMKARRPELRAVFASGYSEEALGSNFVFEEGFALIQKPYSPATLLRTIRNALDSRDSPASFQA